VISLDQVKKNYRTFQDKRTLLNAHTHFLCDMNIVGHLNNLLGKVFSNRNNHPIPIDMSNTSKLEKVVNKAVHCSTYIHLSGHNITVRFGHTGMSEGNVVSNILSGIHVALEKIFPGVDPARELDGVHSLHLKTTDSAALPLYSHAESEVTAYFSAKAEVPIANKKGDKKTKNTKASAVVSSASVTSVVSDPKSKVKSDKLGSSTKKDEVPPSSAKKAEAPAKSTKKDEVPPSSAKKAEAPAKSTKKDEVPPSSVKKAEAPAKSAQKDEVPPSSAKKAEAPAKSAQKDEVPPSSAKKAEAPAKSAKKDEVPPSSAKKAEAPAKSAQKDEVPPSSAKKAEAPPKSAKKVTRARVEVDESESDSQAAAGPSPKKVRVTRSSVKK
jgi:hypothetical protein